MQCHNKRFLISYFSEETTLDLTASTKRSSFFACDMDDNCNDVLSQNLSKLNLDIWGRKEMIVYLEHVVMALLTGRYK